MQNYEERKDRLINYISKKGYKVDVWRNTIKTNMYFDVADKYWCENNIFEFTITEVEHGSIVEII